MCDDVFQGRINDWSDWGRVFQSIQLFQPLADRIMMQAGLPTGQLQRLTPGTHAVFGMGETVIKMFAPPESGLDGSIDFANERTATRLAESAGLPVAKILADGVIADRYCFNYIIMEKMAGRPSAEIWPELTETRKLNLCVKMNEYLSRLRASEAVLPHSDDLRIMPSRDLRWQSMDPDLAAAMISLAQKALDSAANSAVLVHGDLTAENMLITEDDDWVFLDFADSKIAPVFYEWPPLVFDLFRSEPACVKVLADTWNEQPLIDTLVHALAVHDFGGDIIRIFLRDHSIEPLSVSSISQLRQILQKELMI